MKIKNFILYVSISILFVACGGSGNSGSFFADKPSVVGVQKSYTFNKKDGKEDEINLLSGAYDKNGDSLIAIVSSSTPLPSYMSLKDSKLYINTSEVTFTDNNNITVNLKIDVISSSNKNSSYDLTIILKPKLKGIDTTPPIIDGINQTFQTVVGKTLELKKLTASDNVDSSVAVRMGGNVDFYKVGSYPITYTAIDSAGNSSTVTHTYRVVDASSGQGSVLPPQFNKVNQTFTTTVGKPLTPSEVTATGENVQVTKKAQVLDSSGNFVDGSLDFNKVGTYRIVFTAKNSAGSNTLIHTYQVLPVGQSVEDTQAPKFLDSSRTINVEKGKTITFPPVQNAALDNVDGVVNATKTGEVDVNTVGTYFVYYTATDRAGNSSGILYTYVVEEATTTP